MAVGYKLQYFVHVAVVVQSSPDFPLNRDYGVCHFMMLVNSSVIHSCNCFGLELLAAWMAVGYKLQYFVHVAVVQRAHGLEP
jgi:hypothetical protein